MLPIWGPWGANVQCVATLCYLNVSSTRSHNATYEKSGIIVSPILTSTNMLSIYMLKKRKNSKKTKYIRKGDRQPRCVTSRVSSSGIHCNFSLWCYKISLPWNLMCSSVKHSVGKRNTKQIIVMSCRLQLKKTPPNNRLCEMCRIKVQECRNSTIWHLGNLSLQFDVRGLDVMIGDQPSIMSKECRIVLMMTMACSYGDLGICYVATTALVPVGSVPKTENLYIIHI